MLNKHAKLDIKARQVFQSVQEKCILSLLVTNYDFCKKAFNFNVKLNKYANNKYADKKHYNETYTKLTNISSTVFLYFNLSFFSEFHEAED